MFKHFFSFLAGAGMLASTVLPLIAPAEHLGWLRWKISIVVCAVVALIALAIQLVLQYREEKENKIQQEARDKRFKELMSLRLASQGGAQTKVETSNPLRAKVVQLGHDLFAFLREKGPSPDPQIDKVMPMIERLKITARARGPYVEAIHFGYQHKFKQRVIDLFNELAEHGIKDPEIEDWETNPPQIQNEQRVREVAERLFLLAAKMDITDAAKGT